MSNKNWESMKLAISNKCNLPAESITYSRESGIVRVSGKSFAIYDEPRNKLHRFGAVVRFDLP